MKLHPLILSFVLLLLFSFSSQSQDSSRDYLLIADFNNGNPLNEQGELAKWNYGVLLKMTTGFSELSGNDPKYASHAAYIEFQPGKKKKNDWGGGGLVVNFLAMNKEIDLSKYDTLQFDVKVSSNSVLNDLRIKLEDGGQGKSPELPISRYIDALSTEWQRVYIPLAHFQIPRASKFVTVNVKDQNNEEVNGTLWVDNLSLFKYAYKDTTPPPPPCLLEAFTFNPIDSFISSDGDVPQMLKGTFASNSIDLFETYVWLGLIDMHNNIYLQELVEFFADGTWEGITFPGSDIRGVYAICAPDDQVNEAVSDLKAKGTDGIRRSQLMATGAKIIARFTKRN